MIRERHQKIGKQSGPYATNGAMRGLRAVWNTARKKDEVLPESPTVAVAWFEERRRESAVPLAQLPQWLVEVEALRPRELTTTSKQFSPASAGKASPLSVART